MGQRSLWVLKSALVGVASGLAIHFVNALWTRTMGDVGRALVDLPQRVFYPGATLGRLITYLREDTVEEAQRTPLLMGTLLNAAIYIAAVGYFRLWWARGRVAKALLAIPAGVYLLGEISGIGVFWWLMVAISVRR